MKKLLLTILLVWAAPVSAEDFSARAGFKFLYASEKAVPLALEINSTVFAPKFFGFSWDVKAAELEALGFDCEIGRLTQRNICQHNRYKLLPNYPAVNIKNYLTFTFGHPEGNCAGKVATITYNEVISDKLEGQKISQKVSYMRYDEAKAAISRKYIEYRPAVALTEIVHGSKEYGYRLGAKIEVLRLDNSGGFDLVVRYRAQCKVDEIVGANGLLTEVIEDKI